MALKMCSLAAQGLWMRMLCIAAQHDPTGYVSINRVGLDPEGISRIVGAGVDEVRSLIGELSLNGVFSRDRNGTIYNRRMVRDAKKALVARRNGKLGGNPKLTCRTPTPHPSDHELPKSPPNVSLSKITYISPSDKGRDKGGLKAVDKLKPIYRESSLRSDSKNIDFPSENLVNGKPVDAAETDLLGLKIDRKKPGDEELLQEIAGQWQDLASSAGLPQIDDITPPRQAAIRARVRDFKSRGCCDPAAGMAELVAKIRGSPFLLGQTSAGFRATFDFVMKSSNYHKIMDGNYEGKPAGKTFNCNSRY